MSRFTVDDIKRETVRAFKPLRCKVRNFDYDSGFEFSVFDAEDPALVYMGKLRTSQYQDPAALAQVLRQWRIVVAAKGHELAPWTAPSAAPHEDVHQEGLEGGCDQSACRSAGICVRNPSGIDSIIAR